MKLDQKTISNLFLKRVEKTPHHDAVGWIESNTVRYLSFETYFNEVSKISNGLYSLGISKEDKVSILGQTSLKWNLLDLGSLCAGTTVVPIYHTYTEEEVEYILNHSGATLIFVENSSQLKKVTDVQEKLTTLKWIVMFNEIEASDKEKIKEGITIFSLQELKEQGKDFAEKQPQYHKEKMNSIQEADMASIIYTSGTTGVPKGAVVTHKAVTTMLLNIHQRLGSIINGDKLLTFLPLSHVLGRCDSLLPLALGSQNIYAESIDKIIDNLALVKPNVMIAVPRIFEKVYAGILEKIENSGTITKKMFHWAKEVSDRYFEKIQNDKAPTTREIIERKLAYKLVFSKIYKRFGGEIRFFVSGGAPLSPKIIEFLRNANLTILEGYGLTETIAPCALNPLSKQIPGTVGTPLGDVQIGFADDGEILIKTEALFKEYYKNPEATEEAFDGEWFKSGDIGELTSEGYIRITDRKKDIIITSGGKNVAPQKIENMLKTKPHISNFMVVGDKRKYLSGVVSIEKDSFLDELPAMGLETSCSLEEIAKHPRTREILLKEIEETNAELARFETIKKFYISPEEFTIENGLLTPSLKLRKKEILKKFATEIDALY